MNTAALALHAEHVERRRRMQANAVVASAVPALPPPPPEKPVIIAPQANAHVLEYHLASSTRKISTRVIVDATAAHFNLASSVIQSRTRYQHHSFARHVALYLARKLTTRSLPDIGYHIGSLHHASVIHAIRRITKLLEGGDAVLAADIAAIEDAIARRMEARTSQTVH